MQERTLGVGGRLRARRVSVCVWCVGRDALVCVHNSAAMSSNVNVNRPILTQVVALVIRVVATGIFRTDGRTVVRAPVSTVGPSCSRAHHLRPVGRERERLAKGVAGPR